MPPYPVRPRASGDPGKSHPGPAIAVLGSFIIISFRSNLESLTSNLNLTHEQKTELIKNSKDLAETQPPKGLTEKTKQKIHTSVKHSFVNAFDLILYISTALALFSALTAYFTVEKGILKE